MSFEEFFAAINGHAPFPWQSRAAAALLNGAPFDVSVPTGAGKTALIDAAVYAAAHGGRRRIVFVVDRRIIVDAAFERALRLRQALARATDGSLAAIAARLGELEVVRLRGGVQGDDDFIIYPERTCVVLSTIDQVGSRLLHRGYGVSPRRWPMHAGYFGTEAVFLVDEAHLAEPFLATLEAAQRLGADLCVIPMSATRSGPRTTVALGADDRAHPLLHRRLTASKPARLVEAPPGEGRFLAAAVSAVQSLLEDASVRTLAVVVNRVASARAIHSLLRRQSAAEVVLMTGRTRPADAERALVEALPRLAAGRQRRPEDARLIVVATQTIEVGADFDFDGLVSESAPLGALRQRFGRLDRLGERGQSAAVIVHRAPGKGPDPVYGAATLTSWEWLRGAADRLTVDFGITAIEARMAVAAPPTDLPASCPQLLPAHVQALACTGYGAPEVDLSGWLHGPQRPVADVQLVWRNDLVRQPDGSLAPNAAICVRLLPPVSGEALAVPLHAARAWLAGDRAAEVSDLESAADIGARQPARADLGRTALRWRDDADCDIVVAADLRPGDTLVLPCSDGGCDRWGWDPESDAPVEDVAEAARTAQAHRGRQRAVRLVPSSFEGALAGQVAIRERMTALMQARTALADATEDIEARLAAATQAEEELLGAVAASSHPWLAALRPPLLLDEHPGGCGFVIREGVDPTEEAGFMDIGVAVSLAVHHRDVARFAEQLASSSAHAAAVVEAAAVHDAGKTEPRFQAVLRGRPAAPGEEALAKSGSRSRRARLQALRASGLPRGFRHELASVAQLGDGDPLVLYLVGTHHGVARPWAPACAEPAACGADVCAVGGGWGDRFTRLQSAHGPWRLAALELMVRAADARASLMEAGGE